ncbi:hypothetical protein FRC12_012878 [Ceratobasidium sp. 428]|nr:hypothetical protein FRC12_012878 [Ceratobasidium sp. 428]
MAVDAPRIVYFTFQIFGLVTLPILTGTFLFCSSVKRHHTVPNWTFLWILSSAVSCMLLFAGQLDKPQPPRTLCLAQSALMLAQPAGMSTAALALVWKLWSLAWSVRANGGVSQEPWWLTVILLSSPYIVWGGEAALFAVLQAKSRVHQVTFYCTSDDATLGIISGISAAVILILCLIFQIWTIIIAYRRYRSFERSIPERPRPPQPTVTQVELPFGEARASPVYDISSSPQKSPQLSIHVHQTVFSPDASSGFERNNKSAQTLSPSY